MSVPKELEQAYTKGFRQFSWVKELNENQVSLRSYFEKGQEMFQQERFYWQTPQREFTLVGLGKELELSQEQASFQSVDVFLLETKEKIYQNLSIYGTGALLFGAFAFDSFQKTQSDWGELSQGLFYLPTFLLTETEGTCYLSINFKAASQSELQEKWLKLNQQFEELMTTSVNNSSNQANIQAEEIAVSEWLAVVRETIAKLKEEGPLKKVVLARRMKVTTDQQFQANEILKNLQAQQSNTYFFALESNQHTFIGATPERLLQASATTFSTASVAGSVSRGTTEKEDEELGNHLLNDVKNRQEHKIVVDRIVKELEKMTDAAVQVQPPQLLKNRDIQHLYVPIEGKRRQGIRFLEGIQQLHPTPALGGEPKMLALDWLRKHEVLDRGVYGAPIGWIAIKEDEGEFAVGIRSAVFSKDIGYLYAGCGIVADSEPELERIETKIKFQPMLRGIGGEIRDKAN